MGNWYNFYFSGGGNKNFGRYYGWMYSNIRNNEYYTPAMKTVKRVRDYDYENYMEKKIFMHHVKAARA